MSTSALYQAALSGDLEAVKKLVATENAEYVIESNDSHPLSIAAAVGHDEIVDFLLSDENPLRNKVLKEIDRQSGNPANSAGTALYITVKAGHLKCVKLLLEKGGAKHIARPVYPQSEGYRSTPVMAALIEGHVEVVKYLFSENNPQRDTVLQYVQHMTTRIILPLAAKNSNGEMLRFLLSDENPLCSVMHNMINYQSESLASALYCAAERYSLPCVKILLLDAKAEYNPRPKDKETPLMVAAKRGYTEVVRFLLSEANPQQKQVLKTIDDLCSRKLTALDLAVEAQHLECVKMLLQAGASPNAHVDLTDNNCATPLSNALPAIYGGCTQDQYQIAAYLLLYGARVNAISCCQIIKHKTPLTEAIVNIVIAGDVNISNLALDLLSRIGVVTDRGMKREESILHDAFFQKRDLIGAPSLFKPNCCVGKLRLLADQLQAKQDALEEKSSKSRMAAFSIEQN